MARVNIEITGKHVFTTILPVRISDINYGNHTGNDKIAAFLQEARMQWLKKYNFTELNIGGAGWIMSDLAIQYLKESGYGDELKIQMYVDGIGRSSFEFYYLITIASDENIVIAKAKTGMVCFDYTTKRIAAIPASLLEIFNS